MKRNYLPLLIIIYAIVLAGIAIFQDSSAAAENPTLEYIFIGMILILFICGVVLYRKKYQMAKEGLSANDEMSKKIVGRSAATSFYLSLLLWMIISIAQDNLQFVAGDMIGYGMIGMVTIFVVTLTYFNYNGIKN